MRAFAQSIANISQKPIHTQDTQLSSYDMLLSFGYFWQEIPAYRQLFVLHPLFMQSSSHTQSLRYEIGTEFGLSWLLAQSLSPLLDTSLPLSQELNSKLAKIDIGYLASETNIAEEECAEITAKALNAKSIGIILGKELALHPHAKDIALICGILGTSKKIHIIMPELKEILTPLQMPDVKLQICEELPESNGHFVYTLPLTPPCSSNILKLPPLFYPALGLKDNQRITLTFEDKSISAICKCKKDQKGTIALLYLSETMAVGYPYKKVEVIL